MMEFDWNDLAFGSKKSINDLKATFIAAPRELSIARFAQLIKEYLPQSNIVLGLAKELYIDGFTGQPQFKTLQQKTVQGIIDKVATSSPKYKIYLLHYFQRDIQFILEKLRFRRAIFINGSWHYSFHMSPAYYTLASIGTRYQLVSPFMDEVEAKREAVRLQKEFSPPKPGDYTEPDMLGLAAVAAKRSFDYTYQTGVALGKKAGTFYTLLATTYNKVVPYQTYAMHFGNLREQHFSPANDLNYYDTTHAEVELLLTAQKDKIDLHGTTMFINLLPCPTCARMLSQTDIAEFVYREDHSDGYAVSMLELAGKKVRRVVL